MSDPDPVEAVDDELEHVLACLRSSGEVSLVAALEPNAAKVLVLAAASYFEEQLKSCIQEYVNERSARDSLVTNFVVSKAIERQYHTYFDWDASNANKFFSIFGADFKRYVSSELKRDSELDDAVRAFLSLGSRRNALVHRNFVVYAMDVTAADVRDLYRRARLFVEHMPRLLRAFAPVGDDD